MLAFLSRNDALAHNPAGFSRGFRHQFLCREGGQFPLQVDSVKEWTGQTARVAFQLRLGTPTPPGGMTAITTGARIHGPHQLKAGRINDLMRRPGYRDLTGLEGFTQHVQQMRWKLVLGSYNIAGIFQYSTWLYTGMIYRLRDINPYDYLVDVLQ
jgi:hypothetical protein